MEEIQSYQHVGSTRLGEIATQLRKGTKPDAVKVRTLLEWFHAQRRGFHIVGQIREALARAGLITIPDFEGEYIDGFIAFALAEEGEAPQRQDSATRTHLSEETGEMFADPIYRIKILPSANTKPISVTPNQTIREATTLMLTLDFSQLPVMTSDRDVKGMVTWESIGSRLALDVQCTEVRECMDKVHIIGSDAPLFSAIGDIISNQCVLVRDEKSAICGIITTSDLSSQFQQLAEPFLLLGEIENQIRRIITNRGRFTHDQLRQFCSGNDEYKEINDASDLTFGEYVRLLQNKESWAIVGLPVDRKMFVEELDHVRQIRNDIMHFSPDPQKPEDIDRIRRFNSFLQRLEILVSKTKGLD